MGRKRVVAEVIPFPKERKMPQQKPGASKQDYGTPVDLMEAMEYRFGKMDIDLAASPRNKKAPICITPEQDFFKQDLLKLCEGKNCWLNPPFGNIRAFAEQLAGVGWKLQRGRIFFLTPASVGSNWHADYCLENAYRIFLKGRLTFEGEEQAYPKDCMVTMFGQGITGSEVWCWQELVGA